MNHKNFALTALALAAATTVSAQGLFGLGGSTTTEGEVETPAQVTSLPDAHWNFTASGNTSAVEHYSPNLDGVGFANQSKCYGHSLLSTRWFQYIVKPLKNGTVSSISPEEFSDFWGGEMDYPVSYDITAANVDNERLQPYSMYNEQARTAIGKMVGYYHQYQHNSWDHERMGYDDAVQFQEDLAETITDEQLPPQLSLRRNGGGHAVNAYKVEAGTASYGNNGTGNEGERVPAWKISLYDPNDVSSGDASDDAGYENRRYLIVINEGGGFVGMSERMERSYSRYLVQGSSKPAGTWHIPDDKYGIRDDVSDDSGEIGSGFWHWYNDIEDIDNAEARRIAGLPAAD